MRARYYDPLSQQFISRDPADAASGQAYTYAGGDPLNVSDPTGLGEPGEDDEEGGGKGIKGVVTGRVGGGRITGPGSVQAANAAQGAAQHGIIKYGSLDENGDPTSAEGIVT